MPQPLVLCQKRFGPAQPVRVIVAVGQARESQELIHNRLLVAKRAADRLIMGRTGIARDQIEMRLQFRPARKPELAGDHELGVRARERLKLRRARYGEARRG